ncbi:unnamed protein product [Sphenostylis stenocarpa]|uniref:Uncharacterized protein n=1 Tax=Sphenostylis stenocarpa TaxID=92480 RepID=A0AA86SM25_9FABA|nr:unnamed protein product [Sphenostylis stenocarpa]
MKVEVEIISREEIRPSSPTPSHLRVFRLSLLDHIIPSPYDPIILFYTSPKSETTSLSPEEDLSIECNDEEGSNSGTYVTYIRVNIFECGGIAIGMCISHRILDKAALSTFIKGWTERAMDCKWVTRRFLFRNSAIATQGSNIRNRKLQTFGDGFCYAVEVPHGVSKARFVTERPSLVTHLVNLRRKMDVALCPEHAMENLLWLMVAESLGNNEMGFEELVGKLRSAISKVDKEFVEELRGDKGSWCNFGFYEDDFGWAKPTWVSGVGSIDSVSMFMNLIILVDTRLGDGIKAWVTLKEEDMTHLKANPELLTCATLDPSPLIMSSVA